MKCTYCGSNLGIEDEICPYCGKPNSEAAEQIAELKGYKQQYEETLEDTKQKSLNYNRIGRVIVIIIICILISIMKIVTKQYLDFDLREKKLEERLDRENTKNQDEIALNLQNMEKNREYLAMDYYLIEKRLRSRDEYQDYFRVFTAAIEYESIYRNIISVVSGFNYYGEKNRKDWCLEIANSVTTWNLYAEGEFWHDPEDSVFHAGEHGAFIADAKKDAQDLVQVYFNLTDEQAENMWTMEEAEVAAMLYENCQILYPEDI